MRLKTGDKIRVKPYDQVVEMYRNGKLAYLNRKYMTNEEVIYGIFWEDYEQLCELVGEIIKVKDNNYFVIFRNLDRSFYIPSTLIQNKHKIDLPDNLFEL